MMLTSDSDLRVWAPQQGKPFAVEGHPNPYLTLVFPYALQHAVLFESIVAMCRVSSLQARQVVAVHDRGFAYHHTNARHALQLRLDSAATCADDVAILTLGALATIDVSFLDYAVEPNSPIPVHSRRAWNRSGLSGWHPAHDRAKRGFERRHGMGTVHDFCYLRVGISSCRL